MSVTWLRVQCLLRKPMNVVLMLFLSQEIIRHRGRNADSWEILNRYTDLQSSFRTSFIDVTIHKLASNRRLRSQIIRMAGTSDLFKA